MDLFLVNCEYDLTIGRSTWGRRLGVRNCHPSIRTYFSQCWVLTTFFKTNYPLLSTRDIIILSPTDGFLGTFIVIQI